MLRIVQQDIIAVIERQPAVLDLVGVVHFLCAAGRGGILLECNTAEGIRRPCSAYPDRSSLGLG